MSVSSLELWVLFKHSKKILKFRKRNYLLIHERITEWVSKDFSLIFCLGFGVDVLAFIARRMIDSGPSKLRWAVLLCPHDKDFLEKHALFSRLCWSYYDPHCNYCPRLEKPRTLLHIGEYRCCVRIMVVTRCDFVDKNVILHSENSSPKSCTHLLILNLGMTSVPSQKKWEMTSVPSHDSSRLGLVCRGCTEVDAHTLCRAQWTTMRCPVSF